MFHKVNSVSPVKEYQVSVPFWDGTTKIYDIKPLFNKWPVFNQLKENSLFEEVVRAAYRRSRSNCGSGSC